MACDETDACECEACEEHRAWLAYQADKDKDPPSKGWWDNEDSW